MAMHKNISDSIDLPNSWIWTTIGAICIPPQYGWTTSAIASGKLRLLRTSDITSGQINWQSVPYCQKEPDKVKKYVLKDGDIVISRAGSVGYSILVKKPEKAVFASYLIRFRPLITAQFVAYFLKSPLYWKSISEKKLGIAVPNVNASKLKQIEFPLPPLPEQHRIVAKIEELFTKLDAGIEALKKIKAQLKRYHQAVLKHAFEGQLTENWRKSNNPPSPPLEKGDKGGFDDLPELPEGWVWTRLNMVCNKIQDGSHFSPRTQYRNPAKGRYLYVTAKNIKETGVDLSDVTYIDESFHRGIYGRCNPEKGDILLIKDGVKTGIAAINNLSEEFSLLSSVALFKTRSQILYSSFLKHFLNSPMGFRMTTGKMTGTAIKRIILDKLRISSVPLPSLLEQQQIVAEIEHRFTIASGIKTIVDASLTQSERLRQSILKRAFEGKLVPQDPNDEPAEKLLERIKAEKEKHDVKKTARKKLNNGE